MTKNEIVKKNLELHAEWMKYLFEHPDTLDKLPCGTQVVILPNNDQKLSTENNKTVERLKKKGLPVVVVHLELPKPPIPKIEIVPIDMKVVATIPPHKTGHYSRGSVNHYTTLTAG